MRFSIILLLFFSLATSGISQTELQQFREKMHMVSPDELHLLPESGKGFVATPPPGGKVRSIAEFEATEGVVVGYPGQFGIPFNLIAQMSQIADIYTLVANATVENTVRNQYIANGVNISRCFFVHGAVDSYWSRDYGPWFIADSSHQVAIVDFPYNRPRPNDDDVPGRIATALGLGMYGMNVKHTGGNYMSEGLGKAASTKLVLTENTNLSVSQINTYFQDYLGVDSYYTIDDPLGDYIEHIDCWGKFLAPDKILLGQVPSNDPRYADYEAIATFFANEPSSYGTPFKVFRVYSPNGQPYTNSYILNHKVFLPVVTTGGSPWNDSALAAYARAMPGYEIVGIYALSSKPWASTDALHCRVHEIADRGMLYIHHTPLHGDLPQQGQYEIRAEVIPYSDSLLYPDSVYISYRYEAGQWHRAPMVPDTGHVWKGFIPDSAANVKVYYAIHAADHSGRSENHPRMGSLDPHQYKVISTIGIAHQESLKRDIMVFPNPCDDRIYAVMPGADQGSVEVKLFSISGRLIRKFTFESGRHLYKEGIPVYTVENGVYLLELTRAGSTYSQKVLIMHP